MIEGTWYSNFVVLQRGCHRMSKTTELLNLLQRDRPMNFYGFLLPTGMQMSYQGHTSLACAQACYDEIINKWTGMIFYVKQDDRGPHGLYYVKKQGINVAQEQYNEGTLLSLPCEHKLL